jgi:hypothetical protein
VLPKPVDVFDRDAEWADLVEFAASDLPGLRIAVVYGRRRQGKSYLLRRLAGATGGLYHLATEQTEAVSLRRFAESVTGWLGLPAGGLAFDGWEAALASATGLMAGRAEAPDRAGMAPCWCWTSSHTWPTRARACRPLCRGSTTESGRDRCRNVSRCG